MLHEFLHKNRESLVDRCRRKVAARATPPATDLELSYGIPLFLDQLIDALRSEQSVGLGKAARVSAAQHGNELSRIGFTVDQVVYDYGDLCQAVTELAVEQGAAVTLDEFRLLNRCLDEAIADAVIEFGRQQHDQVNTDNVLAMNERLGFFAHELRNLVGTAILAVATMKKGSVGLAGATGALLDRSLNGLRDLIDRTLLDVRLTAGMPERRERVAVAEFIAEVQAATAMEAAARGLEFVVVLGAEGLRVDGDRQILAAAVSNLLQNAVKFTRPHGRITLKAYAVDDRILIDVEDECGGLAPGKEQEIFRPFEQHAGARTGLGLGLPISRRAVEANEGKLYVRNIPGRGCVFTVDLPKAGL